MLTPDRWYCGKLHSVMYSMTGVATVIKGAGLTKGSLSWRSALFHQLFIYPLNCVSYLWVQPRLFCLGPAVTTSSPALFHLSQRAAGRAVGTAPDLPLPFAFEVLQFRPIKFIAMRAKGRHFRPFHPQSNSLSPSHGLWFKVCHNNELSNMIYSAI